MLNLRENRQNIENYDNFNDYIFKLTENTEKYEGFVRIYGKTEKKGLYFIQAVKLSDFKAFLSDLKVNERVDYYYTKNTLKSPRKRSESNLLGLNKVVIDIDIHKSDKNRENIKKIIINALKNDDLGLNYSYLVDSGRGIHIGFDFNQFNYHIFKDFLKIFTNRLIDKIERVFDDICEIYELNRENISVDRVSSNNHAGLIRLENTFNQKTGTRAERVYETGKIFELNDLFQELEIKSTKKARLSQLPDYLEQMLRNRADFLINTHEIEPGNRNTSFFMLYNVLVQLEPIDSAKNTVKRLNSVQKEPLPQKELNQIFKYIDKKGFLKFKNDTFYNYLGIDYQTNKEKTRLYKRLEKEKRNEYIKKEIENGTDYETISKNANVSIETIKRIAKMAEPGKNRNNEIIKMKKEKMKNREIAKKLGISDSTVKRVWREYKKRG